MENKYLDTYKTRFTRSKKDAFLEELKKDFNELGYEYSEIKGKKWLTKANDAVFGNLKGAKTVIVASYDTPEKKLMPKTAYYPFNGNKTMSKDFWYTFFPMILLYFVILGLYVGMRRMDENSAFLGAVSMLIMLTLAFICYMFIHGVGNKYNANRNTSGIICALEIAKELNKEQKKQVAFVFTDMNRKRYLGSEIFANILKKMNKSPLIIELDCIGDGDDFAIGYLSGSKKAVLDIVSKKYRKDFMIREIKGNSLIQNSLAPYAKAIKISAGTFESKGELCVMNTGTGKDKTIKEENIQTVKEILLQYLKIK